MGQATRKVVVLPGDGIGQEIVPQAVRVMAIMAKRHGITITTEEHLVGGTAYDKSGTPLPTGTLEACKTADAVLLGAVGGPKWEKLDYSVRPERGLLGLRKELELFANLRPARLFPQLVGASSLKPEVVEGIDVMVVRELTGDIYFGTPRGVTGAGDQRRGVNTMVYTAPEIERIARKAFEVARVRGKKLCSVDKANVLETTELWRNVVTEVHRDYPDVQLSHMYVDNAAMQLVRWPKQFDVMVTGNIFGDILSDEASMLTGSIGMLPSASLGERYAMYEPIHGSAPDIAGKDLANPIATILSVGMMFRYTFGIAQAEAEVEAAVSTVLDQGARTADIAAKGEPTIGCKAMGDRIVAALSR
ncbi:MAG: 3-isopropylmalate dehydrogenase [Nitrospirota bacterium]|nr:3-isopropylmalate dehydrogenase [Nitrospirota bacterium]